MHSQRTFGLLYKRLELFGLQLGALVAHGYKTMERYLAVGNPLTMSLIRLIKINNRFANGQLARWSTASLCGYDDDQHRQSQQTASNGEKVQENDK